MHSRLELGIGIETPECQLFGCLGIRNWKSTPIPTGIHHPLNPLLSIPSAPPSYSQESCSSRPSRLSVRVVPYISLRASSLRTSHTTPVVLSTGCPSMGFPCFPPRQPSLISHGTSKESARKRRARPPSHVAAAPAREKER